MYKDFESLFLIAVLWETFRELLRYPSTLTSWAILSLSETPTSLLHVFLLWLSQIGAFTYFLPYMHVHCQNQPGKHKYCNAVIHIAPQLAPCAHVYLWNSDESEFLLIWCYCVGSFSLLIYCSLVISGANNFLFIPHIWFLVSLLFWLFWWSLLFQEFQLKKEGWVLQVFMTFPHAHMTWNWHLNVLAKQFELLSHPN